MPSGACGQDLSTSRMCAFRQRAPKPACRLSANIGSRPLQRCKTSVVGSYSIHSLSLDHLRRVFLLRTAMPSATTEGYVRFLRGEGA